MLVCHYLRALGENRSFNTLSGETVGEATASIITVFQRPDLSLIFSILAN